MFLSLPCKLLILSDMLYLSFFLFLLFSGNKKKGIKSSIGRLFGKKDKPQPMGKDGQLTPPVIPGQHIYSTWHLCNNLADKSLGVQLCVLLLNCRFWNEHWRYYDPGQASWERPQDEEEVHVLSNFMFVSIKINIPLHPCTYSMIAIQCVQTISEIFHQIG